VNRSIRAAACAVAAAAALTVGAGAVPAHAAAQTYYSSCDKLHRDFKHGVARSAKAAHKQVRDGYGLPAYGKHARDVYARNHANLDRDKDGTACVA
jgi:ABC-type sugar transport system substrate-binding protein